MAVSLFQYLKGIQYRGIGAPNILTRIRFPESVVNNSLLFHKYVIEDGDRPDTIAAHYYGSDYYDWVVMLSNQMIDVFNEWPLTQEELDLHITRTHGSTAAASQTISFYELDTTRDPISSGAYDSLPSNQKRYWSKISTTGEVMYSITPNQMQLSPASYAILPNDEQVYWQAVTSYDEAFRANEAKRTIRLIDARAVPSLERSLRELSTYE